jgi:hypothetical protein
MHQSVRKNGVVIVSNNAESETYPLPGKSPTFYITNQFCRVRYIERLLYLKKKKEKIYKSIDKISPRFEPWIFKFLPRPGQRSVHKI